MKFPSASLALSPPPSFSRFVPSPHRRSRAGSHRRRGRRQAGQGDRRDPLRTTADVTLPPFFPSLLNQGRQTDGWKARSRLDCHLATPAGPSSSAPFLKHPIPSPRYRQHDSRNISLRPRCQEKGIKKRGRMGWPSKEQAVKREGKKRGKMKLHFLLPFRRRQAKGHRVPCSARSQRRTSSTAA